MIRNVRYRRMGAVLPALTPGPLPAVNPLTLKPVVINAAAMAPVTVPAAAPSPLDVLVNGVETGPGTANPQAGEIAGANPGLSQLADYLGMSTGQTQAWINAQTGQATAAPATAPPVIAVTPGGASPTVAVPMPVSSSQCAPGYFLYQGSCQPDIGVTFYPPATAPATSSTPFTASDLQTADVEAVQQLLYQYGDTWDNPQTVVDNMYAAGYAPGTINQTNALPYLTGLTTSTTAATTTSSLSTTLSDIPAWGWAAIAGAAVLLLSRSKK
jgi:hypothetical protein